MRAPSYNSHHTIVTSSGQLPAHAHQLQRSRFVSAHSSAFNGKNNTEQQQGSSSSNQQRKEKILAERFKTQMCRNYERKGSCPYENKCMFAHGDADLRTPEMNVRDGLFTEESIEAFRRAQRLLKKRANQAARLAAAAANPAAGHAEADARPTEIDAFETSALNSAEEYEATAQNGTTPTAFPSTVAATPALHYANSSTCRTASASVSSAASVSSVGEGTESELDAEAEDDSVAICKKEGLLLQSNESEEKRSLSNSSSATPYAAGARYRHNPYSASSSISLISGVASPEFAPDHQ